MLAPVPAAPAAPRDLRPLRILFVAWKDLAHPESGGSEVVVDELATRLARRGHDVTLLCAGPVGDREYRVVANGGMYGQYLRAPVRYAREFRDADLVVDVVNGMPFFSPVWRHGARVGMVFHVHGEQWDRYFAPPVATTFRRVEAQGIPIAYRHTDIVTISQSTADDLVGLGLDEAQVSVMHLGVNVAPLAAPVARAAEPTFLYLGRAANKRVDLLLDVWPEVAARTGGRLVLAGDGPDRERIEQLVASTPGLADVVVEGRVSETRKAELLHEAWLFIHPAEREGWGLTIIEAAQCETPAIAFDVAGVRDAVVPGETGMLADDTAGFVEAWVALANDADRRARLGRQAAIRAENFTWDGALATFLDVAHAAIERQDDTRRPTAMSESVATQPSAPSAPETRGLARSAHLMKLFRREATDPDTFYHYLAADTIRHIRRYADPAGLLTIDIGGGPGYTAEALEAAGAQCHVVEYNESELGLHDRSPDSTMVGDGQALPLKDGCAGLVHSSNVLEHVPDWRMMLDEMIRVLEPDRGLGYLTLTNWYSPWGGHETSPWHFLGGERAVERYERKYGVPPKNRFGESLFPLHIGEVRSWFRARGDVDMLWEGSRYLPDWTSWIVRVPGAREIVTWNFAVVFRRRGVDQVSALSKVSGLMPDSMFVAAIARAHKRFEPELGRIVASYPGGGTVLDVGAWYGPWTYWLARKGARVIAFEPNPDVAAVIERTAGDRVTVRRAAASDHVGTAVLTLPPGGRGTEGRASLEGLDDAGRTVDVETICLDDLDISELTMMKVDVEGHERAALAGATALIDRFHPLLVVEIEERHGGIAPTVDLLAEHGYSGRVLVGDAWQSLATFDLAAHQAEYLETAEGGSYLSIAARRGVRYVNNVVFSHPQTTWDVR